MPIWRSWFLAILILAPVFLLSQTLAQTGGGAPPSGQADEQESAAEETAEFSEDYLKSPDNVASGKQVWEDTCRPCHGRAAYPGKAPKLRPRQYTAQFVFDRVTNGFRKMPAWKDVLSKDERMQVAAYVLSRSFSP